MRNLKENMDKLNVYLGSKNYDDIDIVDLVKYIYNHFGTNLELDSKKKENLDKYINPKDKILFVLVDGLGYYKVKDLSDNSVLKSNLKTSISTVNPTSTACVLSSIASAKYPSEHGILGWWQYLRNKDVSYCPLPFVERKTGINLKEKGIDTKDVFEFNSILNELNTTVNISMPREIISSDFSKMFSGINSNTHGFYSIKEAFLNMSKKINKNNSSFNYLYIDGLDETSHMYGTKSKEVQNIINEIEEGVKKVKKENEDLTIIITADHGQVDMVNMMYLNQNNDYTKFFYALPSIDTRMISFFVKEDCKKDFEDTFMREFGQDVILLTKDEINKFKLFGNESLSKNTLDSLGEYIAIVVNNKFMVCDTINLEDKINTKGNHSGLTKEETTIPLVVI